MKTHQVLGMALGAVIVGFVAGIKVPRHFQEWVWPFSWSQYGHNPRRDTTFWASRQSSESWTYLIDHAGIASPASVVAGVVYAGTNGNRVAAIAHGHRLWQVKVPNQVMTTPLLVHGRLIVGVGNKAFQSNGIRGTGWSGVVALNAKTGATIWKVQTLGEAMPTPAIWHDRVYDATGAGAVIGMNLRNGKNVVRIPIQKSYVSMSSPLVIGSRLYVGGALPYQLYAVNLTKNRVVWAFPVPAQGGLDDCSPAWADGLIIVQYTNYLNQPTTRLSTTMMAVNNKGHRVWSLPLGEGTTALDQMQSGQPTVLHSIIYVGSPVTDSIYAIHAATGKLLWSTNVKAAVRGNPAIVDGELLVGDSQGRLDTLSAATGQILRQTALTPAGKGQSQAQTPTGFGGAGPVIVGKTLYIVSMNGTVIARPVQKFLVTMAPH